MDLDQGILPPCHSSERGHNGRSSRGVVNRGALQSVFLERIAKSLWGIYEEVKLRSRAQIEDERVRVKADMASDD